MGTSTLKCCALSFGLLAAVNGCSSGKTTAREVHYYAVTNGTDTNYYRLRVEAKAELGKSEYRSGWFPARAVDNAFGQVTTEGGVSALAARTEIESAYNQKVLETTKAWLDEAGKPHPNQDVLMELFLARRRILAYPAGEGSPFPGGKAVEVEYNPAKGVVRLHSDEKLIFVMSSDPDEVIQNISNFAESEKTSMTINQFAGVISQRVNNEVAADEATEAVNRKGDRLVEAQIQKALDATKDPTTSANAAVAEIDSVLNLVNAVRP
jgi:hypothetical protein